jgi:8-hydroxy-5-deazaflavin:NADPH oxidoreductase
MNIAFIGIGQVGSALAGHLVALGHTVTIAARDRNSKSVTTALEKYPQLQVASPVEAIAATDVVFLTTPFAAIQGALSEAGDLSGKILVDCTNPVGPNLTHLLKSEQSGAEVVQSLAPNAKVVKAFTIYGFENFENNTYLGYGDLKPAMLIAGDDAISKQVISELCQALGWEAVDTGNLSMSLHLEHMTLLWIKIARVQGLGADFVWARLRKI